MSLTYYIDSYQVPDGDILVDPVVVEKIVEKSKDLVASSLDVKLSNIDKFVYDDRYEGSLFYQNDYFDRVLKVWDDTRNVFIWKGLIKNITTTEEEVVVSTANYIQNLTTNKCVYSNSSDKTPAEIVYEMLTDLALIPEEDINYSGFQDAINYQSVGSLYTDISITIQNNLSIMAVVNELCRISSCYLYVQDNILGLEQWKPWAGQLGIDIPSKDVLSRSYSQIFTWSEDILNYYTIGYDASGTILYAEDSDSASITSYGRKDFVAPDKDLGASSSSYPVLIRSSAGATFAGSLILSRHANRKKQFNLQLDDELNFVKLSYILRLNFDTFNNEPAVILEKRVSTTSGIMSIKGEFLNLPYEYFSRDETPPSIPFLARVSPLEDGTVMVVWSQNQETDLFGYNIYFASSSGEWYSEQSHRGYSPVNVITAGTTVDGYNYFILAKLTRTKYYFKVTAYDTSFNESDFSNIVTVEPSARTTNKYMLSGDEFLGLTLDPTNPEEGTVLAGWTTYDSETYGDSTYAPTALYESGSFYKEEEWELCTIRGIGDPGDITYQIRFSNDGSTFTTWSSEVDAIGTTPIDLEGYKYFQIRFIFYSPLWSDSDTIYIREVY